MTHTVGDADTIAIAFSDLGAAVGKERSILEAGYTITRSAKSLCPLAGNGVVWSNPYKSKFLRLRFFLALRDRQEISWTFWGSSVP